MSLLNICQAVHKHYISKPQGEWARLAEKVVTIESPYIVPEAAGFPTVLGS